MLRFVSFPSARLLVLNLCCAGSPAIGQSAEDSDPPVAVTLKGHTEAVYAVAFTADGKQVVTGSFDKTLKVWDVASGKELKTFGGPQGHQNLVLSLSLSPDGSLLASGGSDNSAKIWMLANAGPVKNLGHPNLVDAVAFHPTGTQLATGCHDGKMRIFDVAKGQPVKEINAHPTPPPGSPQGTPPGSPIYCVAWDADGKQILSGSNDHTLKLWDATSGNLVREFKRYDEKTFPKGHQDGVFCLAFSPDGKQIASGSSDRTLKVWNVADGSVALELVNPNLKPVPTAPAPAHPGRIYGVRYTPDGKYLISAGGAPRNAGYLAVWNAADGTLLWGKEMPLGNIFALALSKDGQALAVGTSGTGKPTGAELNSAFLLRLPEVVK